MQRAHCSSGLLSRRYEGEESCRNTIDVEKGNLHVVVLSAEDVFNEMEHASVTEMAYEEQGDIR